MGGQVAVSLLWDDGGGVALLRGNKARKPSQLGCCVRSEEVFARAPRYACGRSCANSRGHQPCFGVQCVEAIWAARTYPKGHLACQPFRKIKGNRERFHRTRTIVVLSSRSMALVIDGLVVSPGGSLCEHAATCVHALRASLCMAA